MATKSHSSSPFSRISRMGFTFGPKSGPSTAPFTPVPDKGDDEDYIPYNGPYEQPEQLHLSPARDSWGPLMHGWLGDAGAHSPEHAEDDGRRDTPIRNRALSNASHMTISSSTHDPARKGSATRATTLSYIDLDHAGGVGASPMPALRSQQRQVSAGTAAQDGRRGSFVSKFTFGQGARKSHTEMTDSPVESRQHLTSTAPPRVRQRASTTIHREPRDEYYNTFYSTLDTDAPSAQSQSLHQHPYAYVSSPEPRSAPAITVSPVPYLNHDAKGKGKLTINFLDPLNKRSGTVPDYLKPSPRSSLLKASISTPNLRDFKSHKHREGKEKEKAKHWWLSAETWCDALILPRPRFKIATAQGASGRAVSPPGSPLWPHESSAHLHSRPRDERDPGTSTQHTQPSIILKKVRSTTQVEAMHLPAIEVPSPDPPPPAVGAQYVRPPRPKSFAWDDLALPSPVPSLAKVLEEGRQLEEERKIWQSKAARSFQNKRARTLSRSRAKSTSHLQARVMTSPSSEAVGAFSFLATRTLLGNQARAPVIHVQEPDSLIRSRHEQSISGIGTFSSQSQTARTLSHTHTNSLGNAASHKSSSHELHPRNHSLSRSAFKLVRTTATNAAGLCGYAENEERTPLDEKSNPLDAALRNAGKTSRLPEIQQETHDREDDSIIVISPPQPPPTSVMFVNTGQPAEEANNYCGVSPTPSGLTSSGEGVGIAISSPSEDHSRQHYDTPIRLPAHPYAQGVTYAYKSAGQDYLSIPSAPHTHSQPLDTSGGDSMTPHRQPVLIHPYSYAQNNRPFVPTKEVPRDDTAQYAIDRRAPSLYAELTPGYVREFLPEDIQYSPYVATPDIIEQQPSLRDHPYADPRSNRNSELGFADALTRTLRRTGSADSGLGTSEHGPVPANEVAEETAGSSVLQNGRHLDEPTTSPVTPRRNFGSTLRPSLPSRSTQWSNHTLASSPTNSISRPAFRQSPESTVGGGRTHNEQSSGSSPAMISHDSSPALSPRPINFSDDLERYRDLFFQPVSRSGSPSATDRSVVSPESREGASDITSQLKRTASGLAHLARQLHEDLEEFQYRPRLSADSMDTHTSPVWGRRYGGLRGERREDTADPNIVLSRSSSHSPPGGIVPLRLPAEQPSADLELVTMSDIPEDVHSTRGSSDLELSPYIEDDVGERFRLGSIDAVSMPSVIASPKRFSSHLSVVEHRRSGNSKDDDLPPSRAISQGSSQLNPHSASVARSSFMTVDTNISRMSGLSDFPAPPLVTPAHMDVIQSYFEGGPSLAGGRPLHPTSSPHLVHESSHGTFGRGGDYNVGEAF